MAKGLTNLPICPHNKFMPKNKTKGPETPAPVITPVPDIGQEARSLLLQKIDQQLADLERVAQDLLAVRKSLTAAASISMENTLQVMQAARKRGRPPGSKNKPKTDGQGKSQGEGQSSASPGADTDTFAQAVEATKPEHDKEFAA